MIYKTVISMIKGDDTMMTLAEINAKIEEKEKELLEWKRLLGKTKDALRCKDVEFIPFHHYMKKPKGVK